jgi:protein-disulfide isomerase/uncharacterized membrane protein
MKRWALWVSFAGAVWGAFFSILSVTQHMRIARDGLAEASFCAISETINCDIVNASSYSEFLGVPLSWWGLCYYAVLGFIAIRQALSKRDDRTSVAVAWFISAGGILYSIYLAYISFFVLEVLCLECLAMYLANIVLFVFLFVALGIPLGGAARFIRDYALAAIGRPSNLDFKPRVIKHAVAIGIAFLLGWLIMLAVSAEGRKGEAAASVDEKLSAFYMQSLHDIEVEPGWAVWGNPDAKVTIVEFSEYQCPFCRVAAFGVKPFLQEFKDDILYYFVNFPLDSACNEEMTRPMHPQACFAARAGICAQKFGRFWKFHDELFRQQSKLSRKRILDIAESMGMGSEEMQACIDSPETGARLKDELKAGHRIYISGTPSIYLDGRKLRYWRDPKFMRAAVEEEIERTSK